MKKLIKTLSFFAILACSLCVIAFAGCSTKGQTYPGDYHYATDYGTYGIKVNVKVEDGVIKSVTVADHDYTEASESNEEWGWDNTVWYSGVDDLLKKYEGKTVEEVLAIPVSTDEGGAPVAGQDFGGLVTSGSTQSSGRLLLAVQDALKNIGQ